MRNEIIENTCRAKQTHAIIHPHVQITHTAHPFAPKQTRALALAVPVHHRIVIKLYRTVRRVQRLNYLRLLYGFMWIYFVLDDRISLVAREYTCAHSENNK